MNNDTQTQSTANGGACFDVSEIETEFLQAYKDAGRTELTIKYWKQAFVQFKDWNNSYNAAKPLQDTSPEDLNRYAQWIDETMNLTSRSKYRLTSAVSKFLRWRDRTDDLTGRRFNNLTVLGIDHANINNRGSGKHIKWICRCETCGNIKSIRGSDLRVGNYIDCGCTAHLRSGDKLAKPQDMIGRQFGHLHVLYRDMTKPHGSGKHAWYVCHCDLCDREESISGHRLRGSSEIKDRCSYCVNKSLGEAKVRELLDGAGIRYETEQVFDGCVNPLTNYKLRFDFRVLATATTPEYLIEYDGEQHFHHAPMWDDTMSLADRQYRDSLKTNWCLQAGVPLIRIPYTRLRRLELQDLLLGTSKFLVSPDETAQAVS